MKLIFEFFKPFETLKIIKTSVLCLITQKTARQQTRCDMITLNY